MPSQFEQAILFLDKIGLTAVILPFMLVFTLVFAFLQKTRVLGTENKGPKTKFNAMVAFVIAFFVIAMADVLRLVNIITQYIVLIVIGALMLAVLLGLLGVKKKANVVKAVALVIVLLAGLYALGLDIQSLLQNNQYIITPLIGIIAFALVIFYLLRGKAPQAEIREPELRRGARAQERAQEGRRAVRRPAVEEPSGEFPI